MSISDIWFRTTSQIEEIFAAITGSVGERDHENRFEWVEGVDPATGLHVNVSRSHDGLRANTDDDLRVSIRPDLPPDDPSVGAIVRRVLPHSQTSVFLGQWVYTSGNHWDKVVAEEHPRP